MDKHCKTNINIQSRKIQRNEKINQSQNVNLHSTENNTSSSDHKPVKTFFINFIFIVITCQNSNQTHLIKQEQCMDKSCLIIC